MQIDLSGMLGGIAVLAASIIGFFLSRTMARIDAIEARTNDLLIKDAQSKGRIDKIDDQQKEMSGDMKEMLTELHRISNIMSEIRTKLGTVVPAE